MNNSECDHDPDSFVYFWNTSAIDWSVYWCFAASLYVPIILTDSVSSVCTLSGPNNLVKSN